MISTFILIAAGLGLMGLLIALSLRTGVHSHSNTDLLEETSLLGWEAAPALRELCERISSQEDLDFVLDNMPWLRKEFLGERRRIALLLIGQKRESARALMRFHRAAARANIAVSPGLELKLAANYLLFLVACAFVEGLVRVRGPFACRSPISSLIAATDRMKLLSEGLLQGVDPGLLQEIKRSKAGRSRTI